MKNWKTTLAGLIAGLPFAIDALTQANTAGFFTGKSGLELVGAVGIVLFGAFAKDHNVTGGVKAILLVACIGSFSSSNAQSVFKPLPKQKHTSSGAFMRSIAPAVDSTFQGFRIGGPVVLLALPDLTVFTGVGIVYEHDTYRSGSSRYYKDWAVGISAVEGGQFAPNSLKAVTGLAAHVSFFDGFLTIGAIYNLTTRKAQGAIGPMTSLFPAN